MTEESEADGLLPSERLAAFDLSATTRVTHFCDFAQAVGGVAATESIVGTDGDRGEAETGPVRAACPHLGAPLRVAELVRDF